MATSASLSEPEVLAEAKDRLFPDTDAQDTYAVVDTQFTVNEWRSDQPVPESVRDRLAPFNHVRVGSGYPDLIGVGQLDPDLLAVERVGTHRPIVVIEAKGYTASGRVGVERGIVQAYDRLHGANAAYVAAPGEAVSESARSLARELNVGLLGVKSDGSVTPLETPRVVGTPPSDDANAIRFQATDQGVVDASFGLNHPKNYLAYPLALYHSGTTDAVLADRVVRATDSARDGAAFLGLVDRTPAGPELTRLGEDVVRFAIETYGSVDSALDVVETWHGTRKRFCESAPSWGILTRRILWNYPATELLVGELQTMYDDGIDDPSLVDLVEWLHAGYPAFAIELFVRGTDDARRRVLDEDGALRPDALHEGDVFHSPTVFQLKTMLYHAGILADRGKEPTRLDPTMDSWALRNSLDRYR